MGENPNRPVSHVIFAQLVGFEPATSSSRVYHYTTLSLDLSICVLVWARWVLARPCLLMGWTWSAKTKHAKNRASPSPPRWFTLFIFQLKNNGNPEPSPKTRPEFAYGIGVGTNFRSERNRAFFWPSSNSARPTKCSGLTLICIHTLCQFLTYYTKPGVNCVFETLNEFK